MVTFKQMKHTKHSFIAVIFFFFKGLFLRVCLGILPIQSDEDIHSPALSLFNSSVHLKLVLVYDVK